MPVKQIWEAALEYIKEELTPIVYQEYIESIVPLAFDEETVVLRISEEYKKTAIENMYHYLIIKALRYATGGKNIGIKYTVNENDLPDIAQKKRESSLYTS